MSKSPVISSKELLAALKRYGCVVLTIRGSHYVLENPYNGARASVPVHAGHDFNRGFAKTILKQLGIDSSEFEKYI